MRDEIIEAQLRASRDRHSIVIVVSRGSSLFYVVYLAEDVPFLSAWLPLHPGEVPGSLWRVVQCVGFSWLEEVMYNLELAVLALARIMCAYIMWLWSLDHSVTQTDSGIRTLAPRYYRKKHAAFVSFPFSWCMQTYQYKNRRIDSFSDSRKQRPPRKSKVALLCQTSWIDSILYVCLVFRCDAWGIVMRKRQQPERRGIFLWLCCLPSFSGCKGNRVSISIESPGTFCGAGWEWQDPQWVCTTHVSNPSCFWRRRL